MSTSATTIAPFSAVSQRWMMTLSPSRIPLDHAVAGDFERIMLAAPKRLPARQPNCSGRAALDRRAGRDAP